MEVRLLERRLEGVGVVCDVSDELLGGTEDGEDVVCRD